MNRIWFFVSIIIYLLAANIINYAVVNTYTIRSDEYLIAKIIEALILSIIFYFRVKDGQIKKFDKVAGYIFTILSIIIPFTIYLVLVLGLIHKSKNKDDAIQINQDDSIETNKVKSFIANAISIIVLIYLFISYLYGGYKLIKDDSYSSKQMIIGIVIPPYTIYIGISEMFSDEKKEDTQKDKKSVEVKEFDSWLERKVN